MANKPRQRLDLPFVKRKKDTVTLVYDHRGGVFALLALVLVMAILFIGSRIVIRTADPVDAIVVDTRTLDQLRAEAQRLEREVRMRQSAHDQGEVRNALSNEGAELRDDRNTNTSNLRERMDNNNELMRSNREAWDRGMREIDAMGADGESKESNANNDSRSKGEVQVSFSLINPLRYSVDVKNPGYMCERAGRVVVLITVDRSGNVVAAEVDRALSTADGCMHETSLGAALASRFNVDPSAPERQTGTITYLYISQ